MELRDGEELRTPERDAYQDFRHNPGCRAWKLPLHGPCRGGKVYQTSLLRLLEEGSPSGYDSLLEDPDPVDVGLSSDILPGRSSRGEDP